MLGLYPISGAPISSGPVGNTTVDPRYARPVADVTAGLWLPSTPGASLASMISEPSADSSTYMSTAGPSTAEIALNPVVNPGTITGQVVRYQVWSDSGSGLTVQLMQGATLIAQWAHAILPSTPTIYPQTLTAAQCLSITDYTDLRFKFVAA